MFNKISFIVAFFIIVTAHVSLLSYVKFEEKKIIAIQSTSVPFAMKKIILKKKEKRVVKKVIAKPIVIEKPKKIVKKKIKKPKKIVKKAVRKVVKKRVKKIVKKKRKIVKKIVKKRKVIEKIAKVKQEHVKAIITQNLTPIVKKSTIISQAKKDYIKNEYIALLKRHIEKYKFYPKSAKRLKQEGKVKISFILSENGEIKSPRIVQGCSYKRLNKAAIKLFDRVSRFKPIPKELNKSSWNLDIPIEYSIINI